MKSQKLIKLFISTFYISAFTFGGGFVIVSLMKKKFVDSLNWISEEEMLDMTAMAQSSPGAIAVNAAILVGWRVAGFLGMLTAVIGTILPPIIIIGVVSLFYNSFASNRYVILMLKGMQAGVAAIIADVVLGLGSRLVKGKNLLHICLMCVSFILAVFTKINVIYIVLGAALTGIIAETVRRVKGGRA